MSDKTKNVPKIRFPGFTDEWEQRRLGEITAKIGSGKTPRGGKSAYALNGVPFLRSQNIYDDLICLNNVAYIPPQIDEEMKNSRVVKNDVLLNITGASIGRSAVYRYSKSANVNQHVCIIRPVENYSSGFIQLNLTSPKGQQQIDSNQAGGGREGLNFKQIGEMIFAFPSIEEQIKIDAFFKNFDDLITLHQRRLENLQEKKRSLLQKMFPKKDENVPEVRFPGFTDAWEQRKLGEVVEFFSGLTYSPDNVIEVGGTFVLRSSNVKNGEIVDADNVYVNSDVVNSDNVQVGDIIVVVRNGSRNLIGKHAQIKKHMNDTVIGAFMTGVRSETPNFTNAMLDTQQFGIEINKNLGATINQITTGAFKKMMFYIPIEKEEREQVGAFFNGLDNLITLHQRKLENLQEQKKSLLQQMFV